MDEGKIRQAVTNALETDGFESSEILPGIAFHMTAWLADLEKWYAYCQSPESFDPDETADILVDFLVNVPHHLAAASKLMTGIPIMDVDKVGAAAVDD